MRHPTIPCATSLTPSVGSRFTSWIFLLAVAASWSNLPIRTTSRLRLLLEAFTGAGTLFGNRLYCCPLTVAKPRNLLLMERCRYGVPTADGFPTFSAVGEWGIGRLIWTPPSSRFTHRSKRHPHRKSLCRRSTEIFPHPRRPADPW